ncbi:MAG TPA: hypothetical protein VJ777_17550 [Mycobacterium sp.]|nr:hypothetical protein [Mycobacterium sp.]
MTIPDVAPGLYAIVAVSRQPNGSLGNAGVAAFEVVASDGSMAPAVVNSTALRPPADARRGSLSVVVVAGGAVAALAIGVLIGTAWTGRRISSSPDA